MVTMRITRNRHGKPAAAGTRRRRPTPNLSYEGGGQPVYVYGLHTVRHALANPRRRHIALFATRNALARLNVAQELLARLRVEECEPRRLDGMVGRDTVHQGVVLETAPLLPRSLEELAETARLILVLDQITDPHNVGAILRSAVAFGAGAVVTTARHSPSQSGVLAKSASGAIDAIDLIEVRNLAQCLLTLAEAGFRTIGLDSDGSERLEDCAQGEKIALVLGAEGKGLRQKSRESCRFVARIDMPGAIRSLNVSNAAAISLYIARRGLIGN
jgi:23S rRNA (guanosine2251-2'-O)-methyltransferase